jgi:hypothetical protein
VGLITHASCSLQDRLDKHALEYATQRAAEAEAAIVQMDVRPEPSASNHHALVIISCFSSQILWQSCLCRAGAPSCHALAAIDTPSCDTRHNWMQEEKRQREVAARERKVQAKSKVKTKARTEKEKAQAEKEAAEAAAKAAAEEAVAERLAAAEEEK